MTISSLLTPYQLAPTLQLKNRIIMAPMTRNLATDDLSPTKLMADYYARRADAGLIITEGTIIREDARGYSNVPGIFTHTHIEGWKHVTDAVHHHDGKIFLQIWHVGRVSHPIFLNGELALSPSETHMKGKVRRAETLHYEKSRAATLDEISGLIDSFATAAKNALAAGFDGVEIHGANGYLLDQFLHYHTNHRVDQYGETPENMARFALEVVQACGETIGYDKVGIRLSPGGYLNEIEGEPRDAAVFQYLLSQLSQLDIAYVHTGNFDDKVTFAELNQQTMTAFIRQYYTGVVIACGGYEPKEAEIAIQTNNFDLIAIGRPFIANPDIIIRLQENRPLISYELAMLETLY